MLVTLLDLFTHLVELLRSEGLVIAKLEEDLIQLARAIIEVEKVQTPSFVSWILSCFTAV
jgi:hypothetical protein